jgi:transcriptional regulator with XRE-family HTH domain
LSQEAFADVLEVHRTRMGKIERGECNLRLRTLEGIARRIELDPVALMRIAVAFSLAAARR